MEVDTVATRSIISQCTYQRLWSGADAPPLCSTTTRLKTYTGEVIRVLGEIQVEVSLNHQKENLSLLIVEGDGPSLLGRDWLQKVKLDWCKIHHMSETKLHTILGNHSSVFKDELGCMKDIKAKIYVEENGIPKFCRARRVPSALRQKVSQELERLEKNGVIEPVRFSEWAAPVVPVVKSDGSIRICGDYKQTTNSVARADAYPLPRVEDILASQEGNLFPNWIWLMLINSLFWMRSLRNIPPLTQRKACTSIIIYLLVFLQPLPFSKGQWRIFYKGYRRCASI